MNGRAVFGPRALSLTYSTSLISGWKHLEELVYLYVCVFICVCIHPTSPNYTSAVLLYPNHVLVLQLFTHYYLHLSIHNSTVSTRGRFWPAPSQRDQTK